jgi:hypothetical protein
MKARFRSCPLRWLVKALFRLLRGSSVRRTGRFKQNHACAEIGKGTRCRTAQTQTWHGSVEAELRKDTGERIVRNKMVFAIEDEKGPLMRPSQR